MDLLQLKEKYREFEIEKRNREMVVWKPVVFNVESRRIESVTQFSRYDKGTEKLDNSRKGVKKQSKEGKEIFITLSPFSSMRRKGREIRQFYRS